ncbi:MAG TPA: nucleoside deaminase [Vicinamibacteria bacterium]|nr:nucleoside deaminase [Vicinamibacteria bacterium]
MKSQTGHEHFMRLALGEAYRGIHKGEGGPFGACVVKHGRVVALAHNRVLKGRNPTLHAEVVAIGRASRRLGTHLLDGCEIYSTTEPCPMCFSAIHWARIEAVHFGTTVPDVKRLGFNELTISNATLKRLGRSALRLNPGLLRAECRRLLADWKTLPSRRTY